MVKLEKKNGYKYHNIETNAIVESGYIPTNDKDTWVLVTDAEAEEIERQAEENNEETPVE